MTMRVTQDDTVAPRGPLFAAGRFAIVLLLFTISNLALISFGWQYDNTGGSPIEKLHPATWLSLLLFAAMLAHHGNPFTKFTLLVKRHENLVPFALGIVFMIFYSAIFVGAPFTIFVETFLASLFLFFLFEKIDDEEGRRLAWLIHFLMLCNAALGFYEFATEFHLTPLVVNGEILEDEMRSTALLGHPLSNAAIVGSYILILTLGGRRDLPGILTLILITINFISMFVFGGRAATVFVAVALVLIGLQRFGGILNGNPINTRTIRLTLIVAPLLCLLMVSLAETGFFDKFLERALDDDGSANTRIAMFSIFNHISIRDLFFAPDAKQVGTWSRVYGLDYGIENFIIAFILTFGILATVVFLPTILLFCRSVVQALQPRATWVFVYFFSVAMTSTSLASKSPLLSVITVMMMVLMRAPESGQTSTPLNATFQLRRVANYRQPVGT